MLAAWLDKYCWKSSSAFFPIAEERVEAQRKGGDVHTHPPPHSYCEQQA